MNGNYLISYLLFDLGIGDWGLGPIPNPHSPNNSLNTYKL